MSSTEFGLGSLPYGTGEFGTESTSGTTLDETLLLAESLDVSAPFRVISAESLSGTLVRVDFSGYLDPAHASNFDLANYSIAGLSISNVDLFEPKAVLLQTSLQSLTLYTVVVASTPGLIKGLGGDELDLAAASATFEGTLVPATFTGVAQSPRKVRLTFNQPMVIDVAFLDTDNYQLVRFDGEVVPITTIAPTGSDNTRAELLLGADLLPFALYSLQIGPLVKSSIGEVVFPDQAVVEWKEVVPRPIRLGFERFSGEVTGGLLGSPNGQVFFSPAFTSVPNSVLQIESVSVCTRAYDVYQLPSLPDPQVFYTFPPPPGTSSAIGAAGGVLIASAYRLGLAEMALDDRRTEAMPTPTEVEAIGTLTETLDITRAAFLNDARWKIFPNPLTPPGSLGPFTTADNLTPIGPGPVSTFSFL